MLDPARSPGDRADHLLGCGKLRTHTTLLTDMSEGGAQQARSSGGDPYATLGIRPDASDDELVSAYRRLVKLHHPDHNGGSPEAARRFEGVQDAYARVRELRRSAPGVGTGAGARAGATPPRASVDPDIEARMADLDRQVREAHQARERARRAAREAAMQAEERPSDAELGYVTTDDSFSKIFADARSELTGLASQARDHPITQRVSDLIDELDELVSPSKRRPPPRASD
jgi:DnaJ domain